MQALQSLYGMRKATHDSTLEGADLGLAGVLRALCQHGADVNARNNHGLTPLHLVVSQLHR